MTEAAHSDDAGPAQAVITFEVAPGNEAEFNALEARLSAACQAFPGFLANEILRPVAGVQDHWAIRIRFDSAARLLAWLESDTRHALLEELAPLLLHQEVEKTVLAPETPAGGVTVLIHTRPRAGKEEEYARWQAAINAAAATFPGFQEAHVFPAQPPYQPEWAVVYGFDTPEHLHGWLASPTRQEWLQRGEPLFEQTGERRLAGGFGSWFAAGEHEGAAAVPPGWKQVMTVLLALYPTVMLLSLVLSPRLHALPLAAAMFIGNLASVVLLQYVIMSPVNRALHFWLVPGPANRARANLLGTALVLAGYAAFLALFLALTR
jgi:uncharacterized protein